MKKIHSLRRMGVALLTASALLLTACTATSNSASTQSSGGDGKPAVSGPLRIGTSTEVLKWTPMNTVSVTDMWVMDQMYPNLTIPDDKRLDAPYAAKSVEVKKDDPTKIVVDLDPKFKWSDGQDLTAEDLQFTLDRLRDDKLLVARAIMGNYDHSDVISPTELEITMKQPSFGWLIDLKQTVSILPKHVFEKVPNIADFSLQGNPDYWVGAGAYVLSEIVPGQRYVFTPNKYYPYRAKGNEAVTSVEWRIFGDVNTMQLALRNNDIDLMAPVIPATAIAGLKSQPNIKIASNDNANNYVKLTFNAAEGPLADVDVRTALAGLVDTSAIVKNVLLGQGKEVAGPIPPIISEYDPGLKAPKSTADDVKKILKEKGFSNASFDLLCDQGNANIVKSSELIRDAFAKAGVTVNLKCAERTVALAESQAGHFNLYVSKQHYSYSPSTMLAAQFDPANPLNNYFNFTPDPVSHDLIAATQTAPTKPEYVKTVQAAAKHVQEQSYIRALYVENVNNAYNDSRFSGYISTGVEKTTMVYGHSLAQVVPTKK